MKDSFTILARHFPRCLMVGLLLALFQPHNLLGQSPEKAGELAELQTIDDYRFADEQAAQKPIAELASKFQTALDRFQTESQSAGKLDAALAAKTALENLAKGRAVGGSTNPTVANLEKIYSTSLPAAQTEVRRSLIKSNQDYLASMKKLVATWTSAGKLEGACEAQKRADETTSRIKDLTAEVTPASKPSVVPPPLYKPPAKEPKIVILSATYASNSKSADVTNRLKDLVEIRKQSFKVNPDDLAIDPHPKWNKRLVVNYTKDGIERTQTRSENETVLIESFTGPQDSVELRDLMVASKWLDDSGTRLSFRHDFTFTVSGDTRTYRWATTDSRFKFTLIRADDTKTPCQLGWTWTKFAQHTSTGDKVFHRQD